MNFGASFRVILAGASWDIMPGGHSRENRIKNSLNTAATVTPGMTLFVNTIIL